MRGHGRTWDYSSLWDSHPHDLEVGSAFPKGGGGYTRDGRAHNRGKGLLSSLKAVRYLIGVKHLI